MNKEESYKETRQFICTGCGKEITLTKFASQKTCKCDDCKRNDVPINPEIVAMALEKNPPKQRKVAQNNGNTKDCPCIKCGNITTVSKFMSAQKVLCDECKGTSSVGRLTRGTAPRLKPNMSMLDKSKMMDIKEYEMNDGVIENKRLREVPCPSCGHQYMKPLMIVDWSQFGMVIDYQCQNCYTKVTVSEQCRHQMKRYTAGKQFDYTGTQVTALGMHWRDSSRLANALCVLIEKCKENNIDIDEIFKEFSDSVPPYKDYNDMPVPKGFKVPYRDIWVHTVQSAIDYLGSVDTDESKSLANKLQVILKEDNDGGKREGVIAGDIPQ